MEPMRWSMLFFTALVILAVALLLTPVTNAAGKYDDFARCLAQKNAVMYGVVWCPHCEEQKQLFGSSFQYVKYVECAVPGTHQVTQQCRDLGIRHTPTWIFGNAERTEGKLSLEQLSEKSGCKLP